MCSSLLPKDKDKGSILDKGRLSRPYKYFVGHRFDSDSSSSSEEEEHFASPPPNKRTRMKRRKGRVAPYHDNPSDTPISESPDSQGKSKPNNEGEQSLSQKSVKLSDNTTDSEKIEEIVLGREDRLEKVKNLQSFDTQDWKDKKYKSVLEGHLVTPGFMALKVNNELCSYMKTEDSLSTTEDVLAGLTNLEMEREEILKKGLKDLIDWVNSNPDKLNTKILSAKASSLLGDNSPLKTCSNKILQILSGRRAECINLRREGIIKEIKSPIVKDLLDNIPPSSEHLFNQETLHPILKTIDETELISNKPKYKKETEQEQEDLLLRSKKKVSHTSVNKKKAKDLKDKPHTAKGGKKNQKACDNLSERVKGYRRLKPKRSQRYRSSSDKTD